MSHKSDSRDIRTFSTAAELRSLTLEIVRRGRRYLDVVSRNLEPSVFDTREFVAAVKALVVNNPKAEVRIIVLRPETLIGRQHRLVDLAQRLNSFIQIRRPSRDHWEFNEAMLICDRRNTIHCKIADRFEGSAYFDAEGRAAQLAQSFNELWEYGEPDPNFRQLFL